MSALKVGQKVRLIRDKRKLDQIFLSGDAGAEMHVMATDSEERFGSDARDDSRYACPIVLAVDPADEESLWRYCRPDDIEEVLPEDGYATELEYLRWFYQNAEFGPGEDDYKGAMKLEFIRVTGKHLPPGYDS